MASIGQILEDINNSEKIRTGKQMRTKLYEFGKQIYEDAAKQGNANMEVADARGTFDTLNKRLNNSDTVKADKTEVQSEAAARQNADSNLQSQIKSLASGSPLVACSVDEMTDTKRIYVNTTDGHWYYHDGSTWADGGVYQSSGIGENAINKINTAFYLSDDKQLFNKDTAIKDKFVSSGNGNLYDPEDAENTYYASDYIEIKPNTPYVANDMSQQIAFYDENKTYISGKNYNNQYYTPWKSPQNAKYIRVTVKNNINNFVLNRGGVVNKYNEFYKLLNELNYFNDMFINKKISEVNLFDVNKKIDGYYCNDKGNVVLANADTHTYFLTDYFNIKYGEYVSTNLNTFQITEFDENYDFIKINWNTNNKVFTPTDENTKYIRMEYRDTNAKELIIARGNIDNLEFEPFVLPNIEKKSISKDMLKTEIYNYINNEINEISQENIKKSKILYNKKIAFLGDSITYGYDGENPDSRVQNPYPAIIEDNSGCISSNLGINGSTIGGNNTGTSNDESIGWQSMNLRIENIDKSIDYLIIFGGTNDFGARQVPLGTINHTDNTTFYGSLYTMFNYFYENFNNTKIGFVLPLQRQTMNNYNTYDKKLIDYVNAIKEMCNLFSIPLLDLFNCGGCYPLNETWKNNHLPDGLHPNQNYYYYIADKILNFIKLL